MKMNDIDIVITDDGSKTLFSKQFDALYHSKHGAVAESIHVFIQSGLEQLRGKPLIRIFEVGFGSGLNALLSMECTETMASIIEYEGIDKFPVHLDELGVSNFGHTFSKEQLEIFSEIQSSPWNSWTDLNDRFQLRKIEGDFLDMEIEGKFDLVYFDAFGPRTQDEMWSVELFKKLYDAMNPEGIITTYCCKGQVRRDMAEAGFKMERLPGPPAKRHMLRGVK